MSCPIDKPVLLQGVVFQEGKVWVARCFTIDFAAQGATPAKAIQACVDGIVSDIKFAIDHDSMEHLKPVPVAEQFKYLRASMRIQHCPEVSMPVERSGGVGKNRIRNLLGVASFGETLAAGNA